MTQATVRRTLHPFITYNVVIDLAHRSGIDAGSTENPSITQVPNPVAFGHVESLTARSQLFFLGQPRKDPNRRRERRE